MAGRNQRKGDWLATDDTTGFTQYASKLRQDFWGNMTAIPLKRNLQEIATPLDDPAPVSFYRGPQYESFDPCDAEIAPVYVGNTTVPTNPNNMAYQVLNLNPGIGDMTVGCTFIVR